MEKKNKNMVAVILKVYAIVNAIIGCIIGLSGLSDSYNEDIQHGIYHFSWSVYRCQLWHLRIW